MSFKKVHIKALVLLIVFSLNTIVSFACSVNGVFHAFHHHTHSSATKTSHGHDKDHSHKHEHEKSDTHGDSSHHHDEKSSKNPADDCCSKNVIEVEKVDKSVSRSIDAPNVAFLTSFILSCSSLFSLFSIEDKTHAPDDVRWRIPATIQDLRIVIQSFQI